MRIYGFRIGDIGIEYVDSQVREKAMVLFTKGSCFKINSYGGVRYKEARDTFSTYERDDKEVQVNCDICNGTFSGEVCGQRTVVGKDYKGGFTKNADSGLFNTEQKWICDACLVKRNADFEVFKAKSILSQS